MLEGLQVQGVGKITSEVEMKLPHFRFGSPTVCAYCGDVPCGIDHVMVVASQAFVRKQADRTSYGPTTFSCASCNSQILGSRGFDSFLSRCEFVSEKLSRKAKPVKWSERELSKLDYHLRVYIEQENAKRLWWRQRQDWFQSRDWLLNLEPLTFQKCFDPTSPKFSAELFSYFKSTLEFLRYLKPNW